MILAPLLAFALTVQPPELTNLESAVQCAAVLKVAIQGVDGPNAREVARQAGEFEKVALDLGKFLSADAATRLSQFEGIYTRQKATDAAAFTEAVQACRAQGAFYFPAPAAAPAAG